MSSDESEPSDTDSGFHRFRKPAAPNRRFVGVEDPDTHISIQLVKFERGKNDELKLTLDSNAFNELMKNCGDRPLCTICTLGNLRTGKSFLLNIIKQKLEAMKSGRKSAPSPGQVFGGFTHRLSTSSDKLQKTFASTTKGIWAWSQPFIVDVDDTEVAVLLIDTEGINDETSTPEEISAIVGLSLLSSSVLILNFTGDLTRRPFTWFSDFLKRGPQQQPFQRLSLLVHDWTKLSYKSYGKQGSHLKKFLEENHQTFDNIKEFFEQVDCYLLPHVGEKAIQGRFSGKAADLNRDYLNFVQKYVSEIVGSHALPIMKTFDSTLTPKEFKRFFEEYINYFNDPLNMELGPTSESISKLILETSKSIKTDQALEEYSQSFKTQQRQTFDGILDRSQLESIHSSAKVKANKAFKVIKLPRDQEASCQSVFENKLKALYERKVFETESATENNTKKAIDEALNQFKREIEQKFPFRADSDTTAADNLIFYDAAYLEREIMSIKESLVQEFMEDFDEENPDYYRIQERLSSTLEKHLSAIFQKNSTNEDRAIENFKLEASKLLEKYVESMQRKIKIHPTIDEGNFGIYHDDEKNRLEKKLKKLGLGSKEFQRECREIFVAQIESEYENLKLDLEFTVKAANMLIEGLVAKYENDLKDVAGQLTKQEIASFHERKVEGILQEFSSHCPYPTSHERYEKLEETLHEKLLSSYSKFLTTVDTGEEKKLEEILQSSLQNFIARLDDSMDQIGFGDDSGAFLNSALEDAAIQHKIQVTQATTNKSKISEEKSKFRSAIQEHVERWKVDKFYQRDKEVSKAKQAFKVCSETYETEMNDIWDALSDRDALKENHAIHKANALRQFKRNCKNLSKVVHDKYLNELEEELNEKFEQTGQYFDLVQQPSSGDDFKKALEDAQKDYQRTMETQFRTVEFGYFNDEDLQTAHETTRSIIMDRLLKKYKLNKNQQQNIDISLNKIYVTFSDKNATIRSTFDSNDVAIGIDLGTTNCCTAVYYKGKVEIIRNALGTNTTPSYVAIQADGTKVIGQTAKSDAYRNPEATIFDVKRIIGRSLTDEKLQNDMKFWPFNVAEIDGKVKITAHDKQYFPEQISAMILKHLKEEAEEHLNVKITKAVITVPAYFTDGQRQATLDAGQLAGLQVLGILNEPTAAAVAYRLEGTLEKSKNILVYDLGGGTFDVAILKLDDSKLDVVTVSGDSNMGGQDFDRKLMEYCVQAFRKEHGINLVEKRNSEVKTERDECKRRLCRLQAYCEEAKKALAAALTHRISVDEIVPTFDLVVDITRKRFEELNEPLFEKTIQIVDGALKSARMRKDDIDDIVLVGGSTRIRKIQEMLTTHFNGKPLSRKINPDEAVAFGAAVQAANLNSKSGHKMFEFGVIQEVTPMSLGIEISSKEIDILIPKNSKIPVRKTQVYRTHKDNQAKVSIRIYQGEEKHSFDNKFLGKFVLDGIPPAPAEKECVDVTMTIDSNGILSVEAVCRSTQGRSSIVVSEDKGRLNAEEKKRLLAEDD